MLSLIIVLMVLYCVYIGVMFLLQYIDLYYFGEVPKEHLVFGKQLIEECKDEIFWYDED